MPNPVLQISGQLQEVGRRHARINYDHGDGFTPSVLVGHSAGVKMFRCIFNALPDRAGDSRFTVTDPEDGDAVKTWKEYFVDFHARRMADGAPFDVEDQSTGDTVQVVFVGNEITLRMIGQDVYACEAQVRQYRDADG